MDDGSELLRQAMHDLRPFVPHVHEHHELGLTEMLLRDCQTVWRPLDPGPHHVDLGYDPDGQLVGIRIWRCVMRADPERAP